MAAGPISQPRADGASLWFVNDSDMGRRVREFPWETTSLGSPTTWPVAWQVALQVVLSSNFPMIVWLGPECVLAYNDAYTRCLGRKHPAALGRPGGVVWAEVWHLFGPLFDDILHKGRTVAMDDQLLHVNRHDYLEETYWTYSHAPIRSPEGKVIGVFSALVDVSARVIGERRLNTLHELSCRTAVADSASAVAGTLARVLQENALDVPFAMVYLTDDDGKCIRLQRLVNVAAEQALPALVPLQQSGDSVSPCAPLVADLQLVASAPAQAIHEVAVSTGLALALPAGVTRPSRAVLLPLRAAPNEELRYDGALLGVLVVGINEHKRRDQGYDSFLNMCSATTTAALISSRDFEHEKSKAKALIEVDTAKTTFFHNVSHEFRTPLTLMLGPLEELMRSDEPPSATSQRSHLECIHRNGTRLLKLVNTLLDFSRIEAGRMRATFAPTDLAALTTELTSQFRSACNRAGLTLTVTCTPMNEKVYVDVEMWEKIVFNLMGNAFKYTLKGAIEVTLCSTDTHAVLAVRDSGCGIPASDIVRVFERFHRVAGSEGRTDEGSGIGLALLYELVRLHGGEATAESELGKGSTFRVQIPLGYAHLPADQVVHRPLPARPLVASEPALQCWTQPPSSPKAKRSKLNSSVSGARVLVIDDNADMVQYLCRILHGAGYETISAPDGQAALELLRSPKAPRIELIVSDIMMPRLDGRELVRTLRLSDATKHLPVILVSARAGEEERSDGLVAGADDYIVKPFTGRELLARVAARLELARTRSFAAQKEHALREAAERASATKDMFLAVLSHELRTPLTPALMLAEANEHDMSLPEQVREDMGEIARNLRLEVELISDLLDLTKIRQNKLVLNKQPLDLHAVIRQTLELLKPQMLERGQQLTVDLKAPRSWVSADATRIQQVLWNLLGNAIKFTPPHGTLSLRSELAAATESSPECIEVGVQDSGVGIAPDMLPRLFQAFEQGDTRQFGGLGLGLSICKSLVTMHEGTITASSGGANTGALFVVRLPLVSAAPTSAANVEKQAARTVLHGGAKTRVLVVEDNASSLVVISRMLVRIGCDIRSATRVSEAVEVLRSAERFDLLLCDIGLPDGTGHDVMQAALRLQPLLCGIALSGFGSRSDIARSREAGFSRHVVKPIRFRDLQDLVASVPVAMES